MAKPNIDKALAEERVRILLELKNDLRRNVCFKVSGVANKDKAMLW